MRVALLAIPVACAVCFSSQSLQEIKVTYPDGKLRESYTWHSDDKGDTVREGAYERWYPNGQAAEKGQYKHGKKDSVWTEWRENGVTMATYTWREGVLDGPFCEPHGHGTYVNGKLDGPWSGDLACCGTDTAARGRYDHGVRVGHWEMHFMALRTQGYDRNYWGTSLQGEYVNGRREGKWLEVTDPEVAGTGWTLVLLYAHDSIADTLKWETCCTREEYLKFRLPWPPDPGTDSIWLGSCGR